MNLIDQLRRDEGLRLVPYQDSVGVWTCGYGHNLEAHGQTPEPITQQQADEWLYADVECAIKNLEQALPWTQDLDPVRLAVLENMTFNMGIGALVKFNRTLAMVQAGNYDGAADAMLESKWARQTGDRADRLSQQMRSGEWV